jgi:hypothetical protein
MTIAAAAGGLRRPAPRIGMLLAVLGVAAGLAGSIGLDRLPDLIPANLPRLRTVTSPARSRF